MFGHAIFYGSRSDSLKFSVSVSARGLAEVSSHNFQIKSVCFERLIIREVVKTTILEQDPPNHKIVGGICLYSHCLTSKDGVFVA